MRIVMMTNTYLPFTGGVSHSVNSFTEGLREHGHTVLVVAPEYGKESAGSSDETNTLRVAATQKLTKGDFAVSLGIHTELVDAIRRAKPDVIHSHHPFLLGDTALRAAASLDVPLVFTYHTRYEYYTHYLREDSATLKRLAIQIATRYCNMADQVIAPSESIQRMLTDRGVNRPIRVIPTGIDAQRFGEGDGEDFRRRHCIRQDSFLLGHVGRLAPEKNCRFMAEAALAFIRKHPEALFLLVGDGSEKATVKEAFEEAGLPHHLLPVGSLGGQNLVDAYHAMDVFLFASKTETQGMVLAEAMSAGIPVVSLDAPGCREVLRDGENGRLLPEEDAEQFAEGLAWVQERRAEDAESLRRACLETAAQFRRERSLENLEDLYTRLQARHKENSDSDDSALFSTLAHRIELEWDIWRHRMSALQALLKEEGVDLDE